MKGILCYLLSGFMIAASMRMSNQALSNYFTPDLVICLFLSGVAYSFTLQKVECKAFFDLVRGRPLDNLLARQVLGSLRSAWHFLLTAVGLLFLLQSVYILADMSDMAHLGMWMALTLLGALYLLLLRWAVFLPLEASLKRQLQTSAD